MSDELEFHDLQTCKHVTLVSYPVPFQCSNSQVADRWQAHSPAATASKLLCLRTDTFPFLLVYSLPAGLKTSRTFSDVMAAAEVSLLAAFGNACAIIASPALTEQFLTLPQPALLALLQSPKFETDAEATVLLLRNSWGNEPVGKACSAQERYELHREIRYSRVSRPYLKGLCIIPNAPQLTAMQLLELWEYSDLSSNEDWEPENQHNPEGWYLPHRPTPTAHEGPVKLTLAISKPELQKMLGCVGDSKSASMSRESEAVYAQGFLWTLEIRADSSGLLCCVCAQGVASLKSLALATGFRLSNGVPCTLRIRVKAPKSVEVLKSTLWVVHTGGAGQLITGPKGKTSCIEWWTDYIVDNFVCFTAEVIITAV